MNRSKSAGSAQSSSSSLDEVREACRRVAPYIVHQWRDVCEDLGVADAVLNQIEAGHMTTRMSEIAFRGLSAWLEVAGRTTSKEKLQKVIHALGLRRAEDELRSMGPKRQVPYMGRSTTAHGEQELPANKQAKQKALVDRLSKPKAVSEQEDSKPKKKGPNLSTGLNPLLMHVTPSKPDDICEVKMKITLKGVQRLDNDEIEQTHDDFKSTKDDYKNTCFNFVKFVMANRKAHFRDLQELLGYNGLSVQRLTKVGFNINVFLLCQSLGAFEVLYQNYVTGRLNKIVHSALVTRAHLEKLKVRQLELSVEIDEGMVNKYRDILLVRTPQEESVVHPVDALEYFECDDDEEPAIHIEITHEDVQNFSLESLHDDFLGKIKHIDRRCEDFNASIKDLFRTLRILRTDENKITCLQDLINWWHKLKNSNSVVAQGARKDLVYEYIAIVNSIRITVQEISDKRIFVAFDKTLHPDSCETFHRLLADIEDMLDPGWKFQADDEVAAAHALTGMEQEMFGGLLCFLPKLTKLLHELCKTLDATVSSKQVENIEGSSQPEDIKQTTEVNNNIVKREENGQDDHIKADNPKVPTVNYVDTWAPA